MLLYEEVLVAILYLIAFFLALLPDTPLSPLDCISYAIINDPKSCFL